LYSDLGFGKIAGGGVTFLRVWHTAITEIATRNVKIFMTSM